MDGGLRVLLSTVLCLSQSLLISGSSQRLSFLSEPSSLVQSRGSVAVLRCSASPPSATVSWRFRGLPLVLESLRGVEITSETLTISSLGPVHAGVYQCVASLGRGPAVISRQARVSVAEIFEYESGRRRSLSAKEGSAVVIECPRPHSVPPALPRLKVRREWVEVSTDEYLLLPSGNLHILSVSPRHQGVYKCGATNPVTGETTVQTHGTKLSVKDSDPRPPVRIVYPTAPLTVSVQRSEPLTLECVVSGSPAPEARWYKDGNRLTPGPSQHNNLVLTNVTKSDEGSYTCTVETEEGAAISANYTVNVLEPVSITTGLKDQRVSLGSSARFTCEATGNPAPSVTWLFNAVPVNPSPRFQISGSSLVIADVTRRNEGVYQCLLDNEIGSAQSIGTLTTDPQLSSTAVVPPVASPSLHPIQSDEGHGRFLPEDEGDAVSLPAERSNDRPTPEAPIIISPPQTHKPDMYDLEWRAGRDGGSPINAYFVKYRKVDEMGTWVGNWQTVRVPGSEKTLRLYELESSSLYEVLMVARSSSGESQPAMLTFRTGNDPQLSSTAVVPPEASPSLHPIQSDEGHGRFLPEDEGDAVSLPAERSNDRPTPEAPIIISPPQTHKPDMYDLEWRAGRDGGSPINAYFVKYRKVDEMGTWVGNWQTVRVPGSEKTLRLSELESSSLYEVLMVARSSAGEGQPAMLTFRTGKEKSTSSNKNPSKPPVISVPPKAPEDKTPNTHFGVVIHDRVPEAPDRPTISMATESSAYVTWIPRANGGSPITAFRVEYRRGRSAEWVVAADNISPLKLSVEVRNLDPGLAYKFRVVAMNMYGESPHSIPSKLYQVPQASPRIADRPVVGPHISSTDAISDTQIMLRWTYSPTSNNNTPIQGFYIHYRPTDSDNDNDYKTDVVEGVRTWHMIGHLQAETSYDIKMQCFNDGGKSEYSNVMICETRARQAPGSPSQHPITRSDSHPQEPSSPPGGLLYLIVGCVLGVMVLILLAFIAMCLWRNRQQNNMHKYDPPGYLYQQAEMNGHVLDYTALPGNSINGSIHGGFRHSGQMLPQSCHHLHHKLPNGLALLNGSGGLFSPGLPHSHNGTLPRSTRDCEHPHPHHHHNGGGIYTALPQTETSECMNCQNLCNNNRCYNKTNGSFAGGSLPLMHRASPCHQDGMEMVPLGQVSSPCHGTDDQDADFAYREDQRKESPPSQHYCCLIRSSENCPVEDNAGEEPEDGEDTEEEPVLCWESLELPDLDCDQKPAWISGGGLAGELITAGPREA